MHQIFMSIFGVYSPDMHQICIRYSSDIHQQSQGRPDDCIFIAFRSCSVFFISFAYSTLRKHLFCCCFLVFFCFPPPCPSHAYLIPVPPVLPPVHPICLSVCLSLSVYKNTSVYTIDRLEHNEARPLGEAMEEEVR